MELNDIHNKHEEASTSFKVILLIFSLVLVGVLGYFVWNENQTTYDEATNTVIAKKKSTSLTTCPNYTNSVYGFSLTFTSDWTTCKFKAATIDGATATYYVEMPTTSTETIWATASTTHDAGYASLFVVSVYTQTEWATVLASEDPNPPAKIGETGSYVIAYIPAQAYPEDLQAKNLASQVKTIVATFKATTVN